MGAATGSATPGSRDALGDCTARCRRPPRPRRTARQQAPTKMSEASYGTPTSGAQTLAAGSLRDFRVPFVTATFFRPRSSNNRSRLPRDQRSTTESTEIHGKENPNQPPLSVYFRVFSGYPFVMIFAAVVIRDTANP